MYEFGGHHTMYAAYVTHNVLLLYNSLNSVSNNKMI